MGDEMSATAWSPRDPADSAAIATSSTPAAMADKETTVVEAGNDTAAGAAIQITAEAAQTIEVAVKRPKAAHRNEAKT